MAMSSSKMNSSNQSNQQLNMVAPLNAMRAPIMASCYSTCNSSSTGIQGFHYSSTGTDGKSSATRYHLQGRPLTYFCVQQGYSGVPEASSGYPKSPPSSGRRALLQQGRQHGWKGASRTIAKECERLLCRDMKRIFLGGGNDSKNVSGLMGSISENMFDNTNHHSRYGKRGGEEMRFIEVWDYVGGASFRGFVAEKKFPGDMVEKTLFLFFEHVAGTQLKPGLIALIELATECFSCDRLVICLDRNADGLHSLIRDLGWVGFDLITLSHWLPSPNDNTSANSDVFPSCGSISPSGSFSSSASDDEVTSDKWIFVGMEL